MLSPLGVKNAMNEPFLEVRHLTKNFPIKGGFFQRAVGYIHAVNDVSFSINKGEALGLVGESGCGKSTLGRCLLRLIEPTSGEVLFGGENILSYPKKKLQEMRKKLQIVFQDPYGSLNPRMTVRDTLTEPLMIHSLPQGEKAVLRLLDLVGLGKDSLDRYPHEFSGGQRQRICLARALAVEPEFIVCDEPVSALDVSIQAQVINLLMDIQDELKLTYLFIAHDLKAVEHISHRIAVMYLGRIVETAPAHNFEQNIKHPYTEALYSAVPHIDPNQQTGRIILAGDPPRPSQLPEGCHFHPRCRLASEKCRREHPPQTVSEDGRLYHCFHPLDGKKMCLP